MLSFCIKSREEYILGYNHIWTLEMNKSSYLYGQERKLPVSKVEASLSHCTVLLVYFLKHVNSVPMSNRVSTLSPPITIIIMKSSKCLPIKP